MGNFYKSGLVSLISISLAGAALPVDAKEWLKAESAHFIVYTSNTENNTIEYINRLEAFNKIARDFYRRVAPAEISKNNKPVFYYFSSMDEFKSVSSKWSESFRPSVSCRDGDANFWYSSPDIGDDQIESYQFTSLNKFINSSYDMDQMPNWLSGGLYSYLATADIKDNAVQLGKASKFQFTYTVNNYTGESRSLMARNDRIPFSEIISGNYSSPKKTGSIPGQNWIVAHYLLTNPEYLPKLYAYVDDYSAGMDSATAWKKDIGIAPDYFDDVLAQYMAKGIPIVTYKFSPLKESEITISHLAKSSDPVPLLGVSAQLCPTSADAKDHINRLKAALAENPDDSYTHRQYASAEVLTGMPENVTAYLDAEITANPKDFDAHYLRGRAYLKAAQSNVGDTKANYAHARSELGKGYSLNPTYAPLLYYYATSFSDQPDYPNDNTITAAEAALDIGKDSDYAIYLGELYARRGLYNDMIDALKSMNSSSDSIFAVVTQKIEDAAKANKPKDQIISLFADFTSDPFQKYRPSETKR